MRHMFKNVVIKLETLPPDILTRIVEEVARPIVAPWGVPLESFVEIARALRALTLVCTATRDAVTTDLWLRAFTHCAPPPEAWWQVLPYEKEWHREWRRARNQALPQLPKWAAPRDSLPPVRVVVRRAVTTRRCLTRAAASGSGCVADPRRRRTGRNRERDAKWRRDGRAVGAQNFGAHGEHMHRVSDAARARRAGRGRRSEKPHVGKKFAP
jgi:hypothetical protein